jgi:UTP:GlnB (protein PII) uridylyltransferase
MTLTPWSVVVFRQDYYIRHIDGCPVNSEAERKRIIQCLEAAIERRVSEVTQQHASIKHICDYFHFFFFIIDCIYMHLQGLKLELSTGDRVGLLSDVTRIFRENGLTVTRAEVSTRGDEAVNTFYVRDAAGSAVELRTLEAIRREIGQTVLQVKGHPEQPKRPPVAAQDSPTRFLFSSLLFRPRSLCNLGP